MIDQTLSASPISENKMCENDEKNHNNFAVVQLNTPEAYERLRRLLVENGYTNVSFTDAKGDIVYSTCPTPDTEPESDSRMDDDDIDVEIEDESLSVCDTNSSQSPMHKESSDDQDCCSSASNGYLTLPTVLRPEVQELQLQMQQQLLLQQQAQQQRLLSYLCDPTNLLMLKQSGLELPGMPYFLSSALWQRQIPPQQHLAATVAQQQQLGSPLVDTPPTTAVWPAGQPLLQPDVTTVTESLVTTTKLRQRGHQARRADQDPNAYVSCRLCRNRILANRVSNLHNHVRRHAVWKQFHCRYCPYAHTEVAKVRLHMLHNHRDERSKPIDKRNDDMEAAWAVLMRKCFPTYA